MSLRLPVFLACAVIALLLTTSCTQHDASDVNLSRNVESALAAQRFDELERMAREYRQLDQRLPGGNTKLYHYYAGLGGAVGQYSLGGYESKIAFDEKLRVIEKWLTHNSKSTAAHLARAQLWLSHAWDVRGDGHADTVTDGQWKLFEEALREVDQSLQGVDPQDDPHAYFVLMSMTQGQKSPRPRMDELYRAAVMRFPTYYHYYPQRALSLLPRWYGEKGEINDYVKSLVRVPGGDDGLIAYSYVAAKLVHFHWRDKLYAETGLSWPLAQASFYAREKRYGLRIKDWNVLCELAIAGRDQQAAKEALQHIGDQWDPDLWKEKQYFDSAVKWINTPA